jgi:hypothetical protein
VLRDPEAVAIAIDQRQQDVHHDGRERQDVPRPVVESGSRAAGHQSIA